MMKNNKQLAINMVAQVISFIVNFGISFCLTPFIIKNVGSEAYGFVGLANNFTSYAQIITVALNSMAGRFITISIHQGRNEDTSQYMTSVIVANVLVSIPLTLASVVLLVYLPSFVQISENILFDVRVLWALMFVNFILGLLGSVFSTATFAQNRLELSSKRDIETNIIRAGILVLAFNFLKPSIWYIGIASLTCGVYTVVKNIYYTKLLLPNTKIKKRYVNWNKIRELVSSGVWNSVSKISAILHTGLDLLITNLFISSTAMGTVSIAKALPSQILTVFGMLANVFMPQLTISYAQQNNNDMHKQIVSSIKILGFIACIPIACLYAYGREFFSLWVPKENASTLQLISIIACLEFPFVLPLEPLWNVFTVTNKVKQASCFLLLESFLSLSAMFVLLNFIDNELFSMCIIVGVSCFFGIFRGITFLPIYGAKCLGFKWYNFYPTIFKNLVATLVVTIVSLGIKNVVSISNWGMLIVCIGLSVCVTCLINYFILLGKDERQTIKSKLLRH